MTRNRPIPSLTEPERDYVRALLAYEDEAILAFNKPSGLPTQVRGNRARNLDHLLWAFAKSNGKRPRLVHRIDAETSGVLVVARTQPAAAHLSESFAERRAQKTYLALVRGNLPEQNEGVIEAAIARRPGERGGEIAKIVDGGAEGAKPARTAWRVLVRKNDTALMQLTPETGRMHQIRVHLAYIGCPILGDRIYGAGRLSAERCMLHASGLVIPHPGGGTLDVSAPLPADFTARAQTAGLDIAPLAQAPASS